MQYHAHVIVNGEKHKVLVRTAPTYHTLKLRASGSDGLHLEDEELHLSTHPDILIRLLKGQVVKL